jgi:hypothetical protein
MPISSHPQFTVGDRVRILSSGLPGKVAEIDPEQSAYVVEINGNPQFRLLCTEDQLRPFLNSPGQLDR